MTGVTLYVLSLRMGTEVGLNGGGSIRSVNWLDVKCDVSTRRVSRFHQRDLGLQRSLTAGVRLAQARHVRGHVTSAIAQWTKKCTSWYLIRLDIKSNQCLPR